MIGFFRRIRKKLADDNQFFKYTRYAVGEIVLVMVGILLALQVNNWNEQRKDKAFETKMLVELSLALGNDLDYIENHSLGYRTKQVENSVNYFKTLLKNDKANLDSLRYHFNWTTFGLTFQINEGPYQGLKSVGMDKISNDNLRNQIQHFYDFEIPRYEELIEWNENSIKEHLPLKEMFYKDYEYRVEGDKVNIYRKLVSGKFWIEPKFLELLKASERRFEWNKNQFSRLISDLKSLKEMVDLELAKRDE